MVSLYFGLTVETNSNTATKMMNFYISGLVYMPKKRQRKHYSDEDMAMALEMVRSGQMTKTKAALTFGVPRTTMHDRLSGRTPEKNTLFTFQPHPC